MRAIGIDPSTGPKTPEPPEAEERDRQHISARRPRRPATQHRETGWRVATREFKALYGGELVTITKGERVVPDHELVAKHPDAFRRA